MANSDNLIPFSERTESELRVITANGGRNSGIARRAKKRFAQYIASIMEAPVTKNGEVQKNAEGEPLTTKEALALRLTKFAFDGDSAAMVRLLKFIEDEEDKEDAKEADAQNRIERIHDFLSWRRHEGGMCFVYGTTRSGKTYAIVQWLMDSLASGRISGRILICGQTVPFLKNGAAAYIRDLGKYYPTLEVMQRGFEVRGEHGSIFLQSFDNPSRALSSQWACIYANEGNCMDMATVDALRVRNSGLFICDFNPSVADWWGVKMQGEVNSLFCTFKDNPFLSETQLEAIESIRLRGETAPVGSYAHWFYKVYYLGQFAEMGGGVFLNVRRIPFEEWETMSEGLLRVWGIDLGDTNDPNALVQVALDKENNRLFVRCTLYQSQLSDAMVETALETHKVERLVFETATGGNTRARNWRELGYAGKLWPAEKEPVASSVFNLCDYEVLCADDITAKEFSGYRLEEGKFKGPDHCIDATRYVAHLLLTNKIRQ